MSGPKPVMTPRAWSLSRRAWTVPRATRRRRASSSTPSRGAAASSAINRRSTSSRLLHMDSLPNRWRRQGDRSAQPGRAAVDVLEPRSRPMGGMATTTAPLDDRPRRPPPRLGLHRVLGRQRPGLRRLPHGGASASAAPPTPAPRRACATRPATSSSRATSASSCRARSTADSPIAAHVRGPRRRRPRPGLARRRRRRPPSTPRSPAARRVGAGAVDRDRRRRRRSSWPRSRPTARRVHTFVDRAALRAAGSSSPATPPRTCRPTPVGPGRRADAHRPRRRQRRAGQARRLGRASTATCSASPQLRPLRRRPDRAPSTRR